MGYRYKKAFTMAEAILVMTILGIIATIMITTLKPAHFKEKALEILAKKVINEIDTATSLILNNNSANGTMQTLFLDKPENYFAFGSDYSKIKTLYSKYLAISRKEFSVGISGFADLDNYISSSSTAYSQAKPFYLKDGALIYLGVGEALGLNIARQNDIYDDQVLALAAAKFDENMLLSAGVMMEIHKGSVTTSGSNYVFINSGYKCTIPQENCSISGSDSYACLIEDPSMYCVPAGSEDSPSDGEPDTPEVSEPVNPPENSDVSGNIKVKECSYIKETLLGMLFVDINGEEEPNTVYLDQFYIPIGVQGIIWEQFCMKKP